MKKIGLVMLTVAALVMAGCHCKDKGEEKPEQPAAGQKPKDHPAH